MIFHIFLIFTRKLNRRDCKKPKQILLSDINNIQEKEIKYWYLIKVFLMKKISTDSIKYICFIALLE